MKNNSSNRGFFRRALDVVIEARQRQADLYVANWSRVYGNDILQGSGRGTSRKDS